MNSNARSTAFDKVATAFGAGAALIGVAFLFGALGMLGWFVLLLSMQAMYWLRNAQWFPVPLSFAFERHPPKHAVLDYVPSWPVMGASIREGLLTTEWQGVARIFGWLLDMPFGVFLLAVALGMLTVSAVLLSATQG